MLKDTRDRETRAREAELNQRAHQLGYELRRSPVSDPTHPAFGRYEIVDNQHHLVVAGYDPYEFCFDFDDVEAWLKEASPHAGLKA